MLTHSKVGEGTYPPLSWRPCGPSLTLVVNKVGEGTFLPLSLRPCGAAVNEVEKGLSPL